MSRIICVMVSSAKEELMFLLWLVCVVPCGPWGAVECRVDGSVSWPNGTKHAMVSLGLVLCVYIRFFKALFRYFYCNLVAV